MPPPHTDLAAEESLIAAVLLDPDSIDLITLDPFELAHGRCRVSLAAMMELRDAGTPIDPVTVAEAATVGEAARQELPTYLSGLLVSQWSVGNVEEHAAIIHRHYLTRRVLAMAATLSDKAKAGVVGADLLGEALGTLTQLDVAQESAGAPIGDLVRQRYLEICRVQDAAAAGETVVTGYTSGVRVLDQILGGLQPGLLHIIAARPGMGKSALGMSIADANSKAGVGVHVFSLEDIREAYCDRAISRYSLVPSNRLRGGDQMGREEMGATRDAANTLASRRHWHVDDRSGIDAREVVRSVRRKRRDNDTKIVIVDYLQLLTYTDRKPHEGLTKNVNVLADAAKTDKIVYVGMCQLSRKIESRDDKTPRLADLRESGSFEERAKVVIGLLRPWAYDHNRQESVIEVHVIKNTQGPLGYADAMWHGPTTMVS
jgi:replicative DNA helicase